MIEKNRIEQVNINEDVKEDHGVKDELGKFFDNYENSEGRLKAIQAKAKNFLDKEKLQQLLDESSGISDRNEFIEKIYPLIKPVVDLRRNNPKEFEEKEREVIVNENKFIPINEILSYGLGGKDFIHIHLSPAETMNLSEKKTALEDGFKKLAQLVKDNEDIKYITATSWIVAKHPRLMESIGFTVEGEIDKETKERHFASEKRKVDKATMTREKLIKRYL
jgi:hypothetical protein